MRSSTGRRGEGSERAASAPKTKPNKGHRRRTAEARDHISPPQRTPTGSSGAQRIAPGEIIEDALGIKRQPSNRQPNGDANPPAHALHVELERRNFFFFPRIIEFFPVYVCVAACAHVRAEACFVPWALKGPLLFLLLLLLLLLLRISVAEWRVFFEKWFRSTLGSRLPFFIEGRR